MLLLMLLLYTTPQSPLQFAFQPPLQLLFGPLCDASPL